MNVKVNNIVGGLIGRIDADTKIEKTYSIGKVESKGTQKRRIGRCCL